jgi:hypothetical protein
MKALMLFLCLLAAPTAAEEAQLARAKSIVAGSCFLSETRAVAEYLSGLD